MATHRSLGYFDARFDTGEARDPAARYAIFSSPRTGSNYLCARLGNIRGRFGIPMEYLHPDAIRIMGGRLFPGIAGAVDLDSYLAAVARVRTTADGWFGTKIQPRQALAIVGGDLARLADLVAGFDRLVFMLRHDKLGQAISGAIAHATGVWFNFGSEPSLDIGDHAALFTLIDQLHAQYVQEEALMRAVAGRLRGRPLLQIAYEDILEVPDEVFRRTIEFLGAEDAAVLEEQVVTPPTRKPPGGLAERVREAYLRRALG